MYRELDREEGIKLVLRYTKTYTCMKDEDPMYTQTRLDKLYNYPFNCIAFYTEIGNAKGVVGFIDNYLDKDEMFIWVTQTIGITTEAELRAGTIQKFQLFVDYAKKRNVKFLSTRIVQWKDYKPEWRGRIDNWKEIITEVGNEFFVDFKIEDEAVMTFKVK